MSRYIPRCGDRVKCLEWSPHHQELEGELGEVWKIREGYADVIFDNYKNSMTYDGTYPISIDKLEPIPKEDNEFISLITEIEGMLRKQNRYWSIARIPSAKAYSIYISEEESEDDE